MLHRPLSFLASIICLLTIWSPVSAGLISSIYLANGNIVREINGSGVVNTFGITGQDYALAVNDTIKFAGRLGNPGNEYTLAGAPTGNLSTGTVFNTLDGATDGTYNYTTNWSGNEVVRYDANWENGVTLFTVGPGAPLGITYDPADNTLWISIRGSGVLANYSMNGTLNTSFNIGAFDERGLALEYASDTLWLSVGNTLQQWSKTGVLLDTLDVGYAQGAEFRFVSSSTAITEPAGALVIGLALAGLGLARRKRAS